MLFLLVLIACACIFVPNFFTKTNLLNVFIQISINGLLATGMTYVIITGGIDLSVGSVAALAGIAATAILTRMPEDTPWRCASWWPSWRPWWWGSSAGPSSASRWPG